MESIPKKPNNQLGPNYVSVSDWTFEEKGAKRVEIAGLDYKRYNLLF